MRNLEESDFCYYPFFQILVTAEGKYRPCSKHMDHIQHNGKILTTENASLNDAWHSDYMKNMREDFLNNRQFKGCTECWRLQKMGLKSMRYDSAQYNISEEQIRNPIQPKRIELNSSNECNLKCRICSPSASSKWIEEAKKIYGWHEKLHQNLNDTNKLEIKQWAEGLDEICFFGGEPLMSKENLNLLDYLISSGYASSIDILFNTNGTYFNDSIAEKLTYFKKVRFYFSIDDIGERFEYQRKGAKWSMVEQNIKKAYDLTLSAAWKNIDFKICCTVSTFNIYYFPDYFNYFNEHYPGLKTFWNLLFDPWEASVQILPEAVKKIVIDRLSTIRPTYDLNEEDTKTIETLITYVKHTVDMPFDEFFRFVNRHDIYRQENYANIFTEFWEIIKSYQPMDLDMGTIDSATDLIERMQNNKELYPKLDEFENIRDLKFDKTLHNTDYQNNIIKIIVGALKEISKANNSIDTLVKIDKVEALLSSPNFNTEGFVNDCFVFGVFRFYKSINEMKADDIYSLFVRKYPVPASNMIA